MSVLINGMEMPRVCAECFMDPPCGKALSGDTNIWKKRHPDCPLVEVEPHNDLVDRGWVRDSINDSCWLEHNDYLEAIGIVDDAPTIIEAEGSEE